MSKSLRFSDIIYLQKLLPEPDNLSSTIPEYTLTTDAEDDTSFKRRPFATMTLLSSKCFGSTLLDEESEGGGKLMLDGVFRMELSSYV